MNDEWVKLRDECDCRKISHVSADMCAFGNGSHGDCVAENCVKLLVKHGAFVEIIMSMREESKRRES